MQLGSDISRQFFKFILGGGLNTVLSYLLYVFLLNHLNYQLAYTLAYIAGIVISYFLNTFIVFRQKASLVKFIIFPLIYFVQYCIGILLLWLFVQQLNFSPKLAMILVALICMPFTFILSKFLLAQRKS